MEPESPQIKEEEDESEIPQIKEEEDESEIPQIKEEQEESEILLTIENGEGSETPQIKEEPETPQIKQKDAVIDSAHKGDQRGQKVQYFVIIPPKQQFQPLTLEPIHKAVFLQNPALAGSELKEKINIVIPPSTPKIETNSKKRPNSMIVENSTFNTESSSPVSKKTHTDSVSPGFLSIVDVTNSPAITASPPSEQAGVSTPVPPPLSAVGSASATAAIKSNITPNTNSPALTNSHAITASRPSEQAGVSMAVPPSLSALGSASAPAAIKSNITSKTNFPATTASPSSEQAGVSTAVTPSRSTWGSASAPPAITYQPRREELSAQNTFKWTKPINKRFIEARRDHHEMFAGGKNASASAWRHILKVLHLEGKVTLKQAQKKWENLKKKYKDCKYPKNGEGVEGENSTAASWPYFHLMDEVLGQRHPIQPPVLVASLSSPNEQPDSPVFNSTEAAGPSSSVACCSSSGKAAEGRESRKMRGRDSDLIALLQEDMQLRREAEERRAQESRERMDRLFSLLEKLVDKI